MHPITKMMLDASSALAKDAGARIEAELAAHAIDGKPRAFSTTWSLTCAGETMLSHTDWYLLDVRSGSPRLLVFDAPPPASIYEAVMGAPALQSV